MRVKAAWNAWREMSDTMCDKGMPIELKVKVHRTVLRPVMLCGSELWALRKNGNCKSGNENATANARY